MKNTLIGLFCLTILCNGTMTAQPPSKNEITLKNLDLWGNRTGSVTKEGWKDPSKSFMNSFILPGTGQMYNDQVYLGLTITSAELTLAGFGIYFLTLDAPNSDNPTYNIDKKNQYETNATILLSLAGVIHVFQCIQAPIYSHNRNRINSYVSTNALSNNLSIGLKGNSISLAIQF